MAGRERTETDKKREERWRWKARGKRKKKRGLSNRRGETWKSENETSANRCSHPE